MNNKRQWRRVLSISLPYLEPGESVRRFALAQTFNPLWILEYVPLLLIGLFHHSLWPFIVEGVGVTVLIVLGLTILKRAGRIVVITDRRVLVWASVGWLGRQPEFLRELPRGTMIGSASGNWWRSFNTLGERLYLAQRGWSKKERIGEVG